MISRLGLAVVMATMFGVAAQAAPVCEPTKLAQKYPSLVGRVVKVGADPQTPPFAMRDPANLDKVEGLDIDLAAAVLDCAGIKHEVSLGAWGGLIPATIAGQIDVLWNGLYYTPERAKRLDIVVYMQAATAALIRAGNPRGVGEGDATCGTTAAVALGSTGEAAMKKQDVACRDAGKAAVTIVIIPDFAAGARLIQSGRADLLLTDVVIVDRLVRENPKTYERGFKLLTGLQIGAGIRKNDPDLLRAIADALLALQSSGGQAALLSRYGFDPDMQVPASLRTE